MPIHAFFSTLSYATVTMVSKRNSWDEYQHI